VRRCSDRPEQLAQHGPSVEPPISSSARCAAARVCSEEGVAARACLCCDGRVRRAGGQLVGLCVVRSTEKWRNVLFAAQMRANWVIAKDPSRLFVVQAAGVRVPSLTPLKRRSPVRARCGLERRREAVERGDEHAALGSLESSVPRDAEHREPAVSAPAAPVPARPSGHGAHAGEVLGAAGTGLGLDREGPTTATLWQVSGDPRKACERTSGSELAARAPGRVVGRQRDSPALPARRRKRSRRAHAARLGFGGRRSRGRTPTTRGLAGAGAAYVDRAAARAGRC
jgi:hypothetical protein